MAVWYRHDIAAWMDGTESLKDEPYRVYHVIVQLIYLNEGPIRLNEHGLAGRCNMHILKFRKNVAYLVHIGLLQFEDGKLHNARATTELKRLPVRRQPQTNPPATPALPPPDPKATSTTQGGVSDGGSTSKSLKNNNVAAEEASLDKTRLDNTRPEKNQETAVAAPEVQKAPDARVFSRGREVLGKQAGGLIKKLIDAREKNYALCIADLETASTKHSPVEWIGKIISNRTEDRYANLDPRAFGGKVL